jgi:hypothetical protein
MDFNLSLQMEVHARRVSSFTCYDQYVTTDMHDLSGENLYSSLVKCIYVASDDSEGNGLEGGEDDDVYQCRNILRMESKDRQSTLTPEILARKWGIRLETAEKTLEVTTHKGTVRPNMPYDCKVRQRFNQLKFSTVGGTWYTDTAFENVKSIRGTKCLQIWTNGLGFVSVHNLVSAQSVVHILLL